ncbi:MAG: UbiX family flavin prenyltransferase [Proteobacteria bacterium]|nr:UbiX family flavin prenyltransferase [Pseudomonadota bacterium]
MKKRILLAVTGASGTLYAAALAEELGGRDDMELHVIMSSAAKRVMELETDLSPVDLTGPAFAAYDASDIAALPASGSWRHDGMIVCPCSMASLAAIALGVGDNLIHRAADVALKERLPLILVTRETPLSQVHLKNMLAASQAGATILPACPGFYHRPRTIGSLAAHVAGKALDILNIKHQLYTRWGD